MNVIAAKAWKDIIIKGAEALGVHVDMKHADCFAIHASELLRWNRKINLTAITDPFEVAVKHYIDSIAPAPMIKPDSVILDIGSGGGFPGIPLKILLPSISVILVDSSKKKVNFLKHISRILNLEGITIYHSRAQDLAKDKSFLNAFDIVISRAFSSLELFLSIAVPFVAADGTIIALKGRFLEDEINSAQKMLPKVFFDLKEYKLPYIGDHRTICSYRKIGHDA